MNDLSPQMARQQYFSARELAEIAADRGIANFPATERGVQLFAKAAGWNRPPMFRKRSGRGGGAEYHFSLLPDALQNALNARIVTDERVVAHVAETEADRRRAKALAQQGLGANARKVMEARAEVLSSIEGFGISQGQTRAWAIGKFLQAQDAAADRQEIEARRARGQILTERELASLAKPLVLETAQGFALKPSTILAANDRKTGKTLVSRSTIYAWFKARDLEGVVALAPAQTKTVEAIPPAFGEFLKFYAIPSKPSASAAHEEYLNAQTAPGGLHHMPLTLSQVRHILRVKLNNIEKNIGREGILTLRSRLPYIQRITDDLWPTTIYTGDGKTFDAEVADPVTGNPIRPEITSILDVATRKCVGRSVSRKESASGVIEALRKASAGHGIPAIFYTDRGAGYKNERFDADVGGLMGRLGITKMHALPYNSQAKGIIERFNAVWNTLAKKLPTYIGADMDKEAAKRAHKQTRSEIAEFGQSRLLPTWEAFIQMIDATISAYNAKEHTGLPRFRDPQTGKMRHMSPNEAWAAHEANGFVAIMPDPEDLDDLFRPYEIRTCRRALVEWNTNTYFHQALEAYHEEQVLVGYDLDDAERVWVREFDLESGQPGKLICVATFSGNKVSYVPRTKSQAALEGRVKGQLRLLGRKKEAIEEQLYAPMLDHMPTVPVPDFTVQPPPAAAEIVLPEPATKAVQPLARRRTFASDEELAFWALAHPGEASPNQISVLADCLNRPAAREVFRLAGIDLDALRGLVRAAKETTQPETIEMRRA